MKTCKCSSLAATVEVQMPSDAFVENFKTIERSNTEWADLFKCNLCNQFWVVEFGAEMDRRSNFAVKTKCNSLSEFDFLTARAGIESLKHGGLSHDICMFVGCSQQALKGIVFCSKHKL